MRLPVLLLALGAPAAGFAPATPVARRSSTARPSSTADMADQMKDMRAQMEKDPKASMMMQALRGTNMNEDDSQLAGIRMQVVEMRAGEVGLPTVYKPEVLAAYFAERPGAVLSRVTQIVTTSAAFLAALAWDAARGKVEENEVKRAAALRNTIVSLGPFFIKLGQALSIRPDILSPRAMVELQQLCDKVPSYDSALAFALIESELGKPLMEVFEAITPEPVAAASLGQVYKATLRGTGEEVAVKVQRPFVLETVSLDLYLVRQLGLAARAFPALSSRLDIVELLDEFAGRFYAELDYVVECANGERVRRDMAGLARVKIPINYPQWTTRRVHVAEWVEGEKLSQSKAGDVRELVNLGVVTYLTQLLDTGFFHADPHPGNMLRSPAGELVILDFGLMTEITDDQKYGMIEAIAHLIHRDYDRIGDDFVKLDFIPEGTDVAPIVPALARVFDAALAGGGAKSINFNDLAADLAEITFTFPFRIPPYFALVIRAIGVLEGIALVANPGFAIVDEAYPYISKRLLTDSAPRLQAALRYMVYGKSKRFDVDRMIDLLQALEKFAKVKQVATSAMTANGEVAGPMILASAEPAPVVAGDAQLDSAREALKFFFGADGELFREFLSDELVASLDAAARSTLLSRPLRFPLPTPRVDAFLAKLAPALDADDLKSLDNSKKLVDFLLNADKGDAAKLAGLGGSATARAQLAALAPLVTEHAPQLRLFGARLAARLAEKQIARTLDAFVDVVGGPRAISPAR
ncbi:ABC1 family-domain-containing protein [Pelagophyceae sp. CCMP2097]|nr:ABC1 family-domain-containing protein [Pelagophyceae sp. CCMP2097]